ncbi:XF1762 family protein [Nonomuraea sp. NPDC059023]|uniref:XF1762 family protein n=1 Tax=unclassified Nonomuraea TaxID=2593643 RepID=UPI0036B8618D
MPSDLHIVPVTLAQAKDFVTQHHRHHKAPVGHRFSIGLADITNTLIGVAIAGRPVARHYDDGLTLEVTRTCTLGTRNANSKIYGAVRRIATEMGYQRLITYTHATESGASLRGAGWTHTCTRAARPGWNCATRNRADHGVDRTERLLWEVRLAH